jgi:hypothetical protein
VATAVGKKLNLNNCPERGDILIHIKRALMSAISR